MRLRRFLRKIHRWVGLFASIWLLLLASTGFLLQHTDDWKLDKKFITSNTLLSLYGIGDQYQNFSTDSKQISQLDGQVYINQNSVLKLEDQIIGGIDTEQGIVVATKDKLFWISSDYQVIQTMDSMDGLPDSIEKIGLHDLEIIIKSQGRVFNLYGETVTLENIAWAINQPTQEIKNQLIESSSKKYLSWEQFLFDLHAGITTPWFLNDLAALALIFLSISGIIIFFKKSFKNTKKNSL